jgi:caffeoyl-CoA O-methyltransferase
VTGQLVDYAVAHGSWPSDAVLDELRKETAALGPPAGMQIGPDEGQLLTLFARLVRAERAVEVGTFTGYSSLCIARGLAADGALLCCDVSEEWTAIARKAWERAGVADRIELRIAPAIETLRTLPAEPTVDLAFIDADKGGYCDYWDELVPRVRPGGVLLADNVLWSGRVVESDDGTGSDATGESDDNLRAIRAFNDRVAADDRVDVAVLPAFDGLTIAVRR